MEEILATVRQIIADEPDRPASVFPALEPNPLVPQSFNGGASASKASSPDVPPPPTPDRLMGVLAGGSLPATSPLGSKRPMPFDQDLADMLDDGDPADGAPLSAPKPVARSDAGFLSSTKTAEPAGKPPVAAPPVAALADTALPPHFASAPQLASPAPQPPPPFGGVGATSSVSPTPPTRTFGFPPLRKQSFYPPQAPVTPTLSPLPAAATAPAADKPDKPATDTGGLDEALKRLTGLGAVVPGEPATPTTPLGAMPSFGAPLVNGSASNGSLRAEPSLHAPEASSRAQDATFASARPREDAEAPASPAAAKTLKSDTPFGRSARPDRAAADAPKDHAPLLDDKPHHDKPAHAGMNGSALNGASKPAFEPAKPHFSEAQPEPSAVAAQALDALAQGLAASAASAALTAIPLTPVPEPGAATAVRAPQPAMPDLGNLPLAAPQGAPARTLEDAVADMLRPMLQKWVADNMPRIMERALRVEMGSTKPPGKPTSGT